MVGTQRNRFGASWAAVTLALAIAAALLALLATAPAEAAGRYKTVTKTFSSGHAIAILDSESPPTLASPYPSEISVGGLKRGKVLDVNLALKRFSHVYPRDVDVMVSHRGVNRTVMGDAGGGGGFDVTDITLRLDDEAAAPLPDDGQLVGGTFAPANAQGVLDPFPDPAPAESGLMQLSGFDGANPNGPWSLWVVDDDPAASGQFAEGWSVTIKARVLR